MQQLALVTGQEAFTADVAVVPEQSRQSRHLDDAASWRVLSSAATSFA